MEAPERPVPIPTSPPPGGARPVPYKEPQDGVSAEALRKLTHYYLNTDAKVDDIAIDLGLTTRDVRGAIKRYGLDKQKHEIITQVQQEELAAVSSAARKSQIRGMDRSERIRTYNFPENRIADHRTGYKAYNLDQVMDGALDPIIASCITADEEERLAALGEQG